MFRNYIRQYLSVSGKVFKESVRKDPKFGLFLNSNSPVVTEQLSNSGYDWLLVDNQHGPHSYTQLSNQLSAISNGKSLSFVRVSGYNDRSGIQQALDSGAQGILIPSANTAAEVKEAVDSCLYPEPSKGHGTRSIYHPQRSNFKEGLLNYVGNSNDNTVIGVQVETKSCLENLEEIAKIEKVDVLFLGMNDLCMSMGLFEKYKFPEMYTSKELYDAIDKIVHLSKKYNKIAGVFLFGIDRVDEFVKKGYNLISIGNDLHHVLTQSQSYVQSLEKITERNGKKWKRQDSHLI